MTNKGYAHIFPMKSKSEVLSTVKEFVKAVAAPNVIISESSGEQRSKEMKKFLREI